MAGRTRGQNSRCSSRTTTPANRPANARSMNVGIGDLHARVAGLRQPDHSDNTERYMGRSTGSTAQDRGKPGARRGGRGGAPALRAGVAQLRALAHPLRLRIAEQFAEGPSTTMQVAARLGQPPTRLYHHVQVLERAGILRLRETRGNPGAVEKWYETAGQVQGSRVPGRRSVGALRHLAAMAPEQSRRVPVPANG